MIYYRYAIYPPLLDVSTTTCSIYSYVIYYRYFSSQYEYSSIEIMADALTVPRYAAIYTQT